MSLAIKVREKIKQRVIEAAEAAKVQGRLTFDQLPPFVLEVPRGKNHGDLAVNLSMLLARTERKPPRQIAETIIEHFNPTDTWVERTEVAGPGFINFFLNPKWVWGVPLEVLRAGKKYGSVNLGAGESVQVEFVSANPTGLLHIGHARGAALGDSLANLLAAAGYKVSREFYINDAGNQIEKLAESLEVRYFQALGFPAVMPEDGYHGEDLIETIGRFVKKYKDKYVTVDEVLRREMLVEFTLREKLAAIKKTLEDFGVRFDVWFSEQQLYDNGSVARVLNTLKERDFIYEQDGALWFRSSRFGDEKDEVVVRSNGLPTYFASDIAYHQNKFDRGFSRVINIWGADHHGHVPRMKGALKALGIDPEKLEVILTQMVRLFRGGEPVRMSKRTGQYVTLEELVEEVGKDAARYVFTMRSAESHLDFDLDLFKSQTSENPVYYIQYAHARICSIIRQVMEAGLEMPAVKDCRLNRLTEDMELAILNKVAELPLEIAAAAKAREPHRLAHYALDLASQFHTYYNAYRVLVDDQELRSARLALVLTVQTALQNTLAILGVNAPERM
ncbi:MAG: arginine--tRNA ligase [Syntrophomonadaceae bacterium]|nr:arginine--tRNA ligase [Syntrophomonadaceae bacterium]